MREGELRSKGRKYIEQCDKDFEEAWPELKLQWDIEKEEKTRKLIRAYAQNRKFAGIYAGSRLFRGMTKKEMYSFLYFARDPRDSGHR